MNRLRSQPLPVGQLSEALRSDMDRLPDAELLDRFSRYADHSAFEVIVRRHGPMVLGVCRRMLGGVDADDAFQATFLVLIRKGRCLRRADRLGPFLYGVAYRVALKARARCTQRAAYRTEALDMLADPTVPTEVPDWLPILDAELSALPAKYRDPLVLCELQGESRADAARALAVPEGTLSSRLARGRELLRKRLLKYGTLLPAGGLTVLFTTSGVGRATVPVALLMRTFELVKVATGAVSTGTVPVGTARLTDEVLKSMLLTKLRAAGGVIAGLVLAAFGLASAAWPDAAPGASEEKGGGKGSANPTAVSPGQAGAKSPAPMPPPRGQKAFSVTFIDPVPETFLVPIVEAGTVLSDRDALQGLWVVEKIDLGKNAKPDQQQKAQATIRKMSFVVAGDVWWGVTGEVESWVVFRQLAKLDPTKNPKWLDLSAEAEGGSVVAPNQCIYELDGDRLRISMCSGEKVARPAEFSAEDDDLMVMQFRRGKMPPAVGEKPLVGSWEGARGETAREVGGKPVQSPTARVEILDGYLFFNSDTGGGEGWAGGRYSVDTTKNPKWVNVELMTSIKGETTMELYGCYEVAGGRLHLALGSKKATRPLDFRGAQDTLVYDLVPVKPDPRKRPEPPRPNAKAAPAKP